MRCGPDLGRDRDFELGNFLEQALQDTGPRFPSLSWCSMLVLSFQSYLEIDQIETSFHQRLQLFARGIVHLARRLAERLCEPSDHLCINRIVLGQASGRLRKAADSLGVDDPYGDAGQTEHLPPIALIAAAGLHHRPVHLVLAKPGNQLAMTLGSARIRLPQRQLANARIDLVLCYIDADDNETILCHHPLPSLLGTGSTALATVRVEEDTGAVPRSHTGSAALGRYGLSSSNGRFCFNRPFAHSASFCRHKGRWPSSQTRGRERWTRQHARRTSCSVRRNRLGPTPRCWRQVGGAICKRWWQESRSPGRLRISRKAIAQGRPVCFRQTCMLVRVFDAQFCARDRGC